MIIIFNTQEGSTSEPIKIKGGASVGAHSNKKKFKVPIHTWKKAIKIENFLICPEVTDGGRGIIFRIGHPTSSAEIYVGDSNDWCNSGYCGSRYLKLKIEIEKITKCKTVEDQIKTAVNPLYYNGVMENMSEKGNCGIFQIYLSGYILD